MHIIFHCHNKEQNQSSDEEEEKDQQPPSPVDDLTKARQLLHEIMDGDKGIDAVLESRSVEAINKRLEEEKRSMKDQRTVKLWLQYMNMFDILRQFIKQSVQGTGYFTCRQF